MVQNRSYTQSLQPSREETLAKLVVLPGLLVTSTVTWLLLAQTSSQWRSSRDFARFVSDNTATAALVVQVISHDLGFIHLYTLRTTLDLSCRAFFARSSMSLDSIRLINAFQSSSLNLSMSWIHNTILLFYVLACFIPAALWAGAITPVMITKATERPMNLSAFSNTTWIGWPQPGAPQINLPNGFFTYRPEKPLQGLLLNATSGASYFHEGSTSHAKLDKTGYFYVNRSYGIGAAVGLSDTEFINDVVQYTYYEAGLRASISCLYNASSLFILGKNEAAPDWAIQIYEATGTLPHNNGSNIDFVAAGYENSQVVAVATNANEYNTKYHCVGFATGSKSASKYGALSQVQCQLTFIPHNFSVAVNASAVSRTISVKPVEQLQSEHWISDSNFYNLIWKCKDVIVQLGSILATTMTTSVFGDIFMLNIANAESTYGKSDGTNLKAIEDTLTSIIDNSLQALSSAQLMLMKETTSTTVQVMYPSIIFGKPVYIYSIFALNVVVGACYFAEMVRTRYWYRLPKFTFTDISDVILAASRGGSGISEAVTALSHAQGPIRRGDHDGRTVGKLRIWLDTSSVDEAPVLGLQIKKGSYDSLEDIGYRM